MSDRLTCAYVTDRGFLPVTCFSIVALAAKSSIDLEIFVVTSDIGAADLEEARAYLASRGISVTFVAVAEADFEGLPRPQSLPRATYGRLLMHKLLPPDRDRVLYLDGDTLVDIDVAPLRTIPLHDAVVGAVIDVGRILVGRREEARSRLDLGPRGDYFNAGVLVIDWSKWRLEQIGERCLAALLETPGRFTQKDQCALNYVCRGRWRPLDLQWNYQPASVVHADRERALFHFLGGRKPWRTGHQRHPMRFVQRYREFYAASPWAAEFRDAQVPYRVKDWVRQGKRLLSPRYWRNRSAYQVIARDAGEASLVG